jgi:hypothetical protein
LRLITPAVIERKGCRLDVLTGQTIINRLVRRLAGLVDRYCGVATADYHFKSLTQTADGITCGAQDLQYCTWERYSNRQQQRLTLSGLMGCLTLCNVPAELLPYLAVGQWIHVGRRACFGMGAYQLSPAEQSPFCSRPTQGRDAR